MSERAMFPRCQVHPPLAKGLKEADSQRRAGCGLSTLSGASGAAGKKPRQTCEEGGRRRRNRRGLPVGDAIAPRIQEMLLTAAVVAPVCVWWFGGIVAPAHGGRYTAKGAAQVSHARFCPLLLKKAFETPHKTPSLSPILRSPRNLPRPRFFFPFAWLASSAAYTYHTLARASFLTPFQDHSPAVSRLVATAALSADLASPDIATLPKLRLTIQHVKRSWELLSMHALRPSSTPDADCMGFLNRCPKLLAFIGLTLQGLGHCRSVHFCHP